MKKKLIIIIATCMMTLALAACKNSEENVAPTSEPTMTSTPTPEPTPVPEPTPTATLIPEIVTTYEKGVLTENGFESEWMNLRYTKPEGVVMVSQEELDALMKQTAQWMYGEDAEEKLDYAALTVVTEMMARKVQRSW